jgi:hypothetical protein
MKIYQAYKRIDAIASGKMDVDIADEAYEAMKQKQQTKLQVPKDIFRQLATVFCTYVSICLHHDIG